MTTRSLTHIENADGVTLCTVYRHEDGYPSGHGCELAGLLQDMIIIEGCGSSDLRHVANGMECLAAQVVTRLKQKGRYAGPDPDIVCIVGAEDPKVGDIYLYPPGSTGHGEQYIYTVYPRPVSKGKDTEALIRCERPDGECLFDGTPEDFLQQEWE